MISSVDPEVNIGVVDCAKVHRVLLTRLEALLGTLGLVDWHPINGMDVPPMLILDVDCKEVCDADFEARNKWLMGFMH